MATFHETKHMRNDISSHRNLTYKIGKATHIGVARIFDLGAQTTNQLQ